MRAVIVGGPTSKLHGAKAKCCGRTVRQGESVLYAVVPNVKRFHENRFVVHTAHMEEMCREAPVGIESRTKSEINAEFNRIREHQMVLAAGREEA